jgi:ABC-type transporter Mla MlaB component
MTTSPPETRLHLRGPLTIGGGEALHAEFGEALRRNRDIIVEIDAEAEVDVAFLQLLLAAQRSAAASGRRIALQTPPSGGLATAIASCGFAPPAGAVSLDEIFSLESGRQP